MRRFFLDLQLETCFFSFFSSFFLEVIQMVGNGTFLPIWSLEHVAIMRRNKRLHTITSNLYKRLVQQVKRLVVVSA